ncbi:unnamed protein product [Closterium sp. NIES-65]|nr:unnamed protein product [Closterium sp. NIES-65]
MYKQSQTVANHRSVGSQRKAGVARAAKRQSGSSAKQSRGSRKAANKPSPSSAPSRQQQDRLNDSQSSQPIQPERPEKSAQEIFELTQASMNLSQSGQLSQPGQPSPSIATPDTSPPSPSSSESTKKPPPIAAPVSPDSTSSSAPAAPAVPAAPVAVAPREEVWRACLTTSGGLAVAGLLVRQLSAWGHDAGAPITDCFQAMPLSLSPASVPFALAAAAIVSAARLALLRLSPAFQHTVPFALAAAAIVSAARLALLHLSPAFLAATHASYLTLYTIPPLPFNSSPPSAPIQPPFTPLHPPSPLHPTPVTLSPASIPFALAAAAIVSAARLALLRLSPAFLDATNASNTRALSNLQATDLIWVSLLPGISEVRAAYFKGWLVCTPFHTLLRLSPAFLDATNASNARALSSLNATDLIWVSLLPGISEELLFRGALLPLVGVNAVGVIVSGAVFGLLHVTGDRNLTFSAWASSVGCVYGVLAVATGHHLWGVRTACWLAAVSFTPHPPLPSYHRATSVGCVYGVLAVATGDMASAMLAHSLANLVSAGWWKWQQQEQ